MNEYVEKVILEFHRYYITDDGDLCSVANDVEGTYIKTWLRTKLSEAFREGENSVYKKLGFLRQWLNEDRITDPAKMVSTEELEGFLRHLTQDK